ncbi:hypothetical protein TrST_g1860 [Triparma strigata]|uniref:ATP synthase subunit d, mitochondrial n=1 Tax=Triparma strigata TaxID=1606541 RepID=A0A9W7BP14_9STRA|nr:hypothetical protein TrST_g1860 [Triparma strigata]
MISRTFVTKVAPSARGFSSIDWSALASNLTSDSARSSVNKYRSLIGSIDATASEYSSPPPSIDFSDFKSKIRAVKSVDGKPVSVVEILEAVSKSFKPNTTSSGTKSDLESALAASGKTLSSAKGADKAVAELTVEILKSSLASFDDAAASAAAADLAAADKSLAEQAANAKKTAAEAKAETTSRISELEATVTRMKSKRVDKTTTVDDIYEAYPEIKEEVHEEINTHQWHKDIA